MLGGRRLRDDLLVVRKDEPQATRGYGRRRVCPVSARSTNTQRGWVGEWLGGYLEMLPSSSYRDRCRFLSCWDREGRRKGTGLQYEGVIWIDGGGDGGGEG
jgi:hypothetical protein